MRLPLPQFAIGDRHPSHFAEVTETASVEFLAQCLEPEDLSFPAMPPFGSWVKASDEESGNLIYGIVTYATTSPIDAVHRARALGLSLAELRQEQPQIFAMLKTEFRAAIVGFQTRGDRPPESNGNGHQASGGRIFQYLPPRPPQIHQSVYCCEESEIIRFSEELDFLRTLLDVKGVPPDSLVAAVLREGYQMRQGDRVWLVEAGRKLSTLLRDDYDRLSYILSQVYW